MKGYKYAISEHTPVLVILDIPDEALKSTPTLRYSVYLTAIRNEYVDYYRYASTDLVRLWTKYTTLAETFINLRSIFSDLGRRRNLVYNSAKQNLEDIHGFVHVTKCRCSEAKVVDIIGMFDGKHYDNAISTFDHGFVYELNSTVKPDDWGSDIRRICGPGIHYFEYPILVLLYRLQSDLDFALDFMEQLNDDFKNTYLTEELNKVEKGDIDE